MPELQFSSEPGSEEVNGNVFLEGPSTDPVRLGHIYTKVGRRVCMCVCVCV